MTINDMWRGEGHDTGANENIGPDEQAALGQKLTRLIEVLPKRRAEFEKITRERNELADDIKRLEAAGRELMVLAERVLGENPKPMNAREL